MVDHRPWPHQTSGNGNGATHWHAMGASNIGALHVIMTNTLDGSCSAPDGPSVGGGSMANANACREPASRLFGSSTASGVTHTAVLTASSAAAAVAAAVDSAADLDPPPRELRNRVSNDPTGDPLLLCVVVVVALSGVFFRAVPGLDLDDSACCAVVRCVDDCRRCGAGEFFALPGLDLGMARRQMEPEPEPERERTSSEASSPRTEGVC